MGAFLKKLAFIGRKENPTALLMFSYSFLAMAAYNIIKPVTRSKFIESLGAANIPYVQLAAGVLIGILMVGYSWLMSKLPRRWSLPIIQGSIAVLLIIFWLLFQTGMTWVSIAFYLMGLILGILLISQFWTLANVVYEPRQAKRHFGFIGGGASLGGIAGSFLTRYAAQVGTINLLLYSSACMILCLTVVIFIIRREKLAGVSWGEEEAGVGAKKAIELLQKSKHLRLIALVISFSAIGAVIIEQQLLMATAATKGSQATDAITSFLAGVQLWTSTIGFIIQVALTSRIHSYLGIGFALLLLPISLGSTALVMLFNAALWAPGMARVLDQSLRYTVDKTTREILYMPLPAKLKFEAKPFVDVSVDRFAKGLGSILLLVMIQPWGLHLSWQNLSYVSVTMTVVWIVMAVRARRGYRQEFRRSIEAREIKPIELSSAAADLATIETLIQELASPDEGRVLYAFEMLESMDKRGLITPLLLYHESPCVRVRALGLFTGDLPKDSSRWLPTIQRMMADKNAEVRVAAVAALGGMITEESAALLRPRLLDKDPRIVMTVAMVLSAGGRAEDVAVAEKALTELVADPNEADTELRREFAVALRHVSSPRFRHLLIPLLYDSNFTVAEEAMRSVRQVGNANIVFVPALISLLHNRRLKSSAREILVGYGESVLPILRHFLLDIQENIWIRRHLPGTIARIPCQQAMDILTGALQEPDHFLRFKVLAAIEKLHRTHPQLTFLREPIESLALAEGSVYFHYLVCHRTLFGKGRLPQESLLARALTEKIGRAVDRVYRFLSLLYPWEDMAAARWTSKHGSARARSSALEYLDNTLTGALRKCLMPLLEGAAVVGERHADNLVTKESPGGVEEILRQLINDADPVLAATAVYFVWDAKLDNLISDLEQLLTTPKVHDWCVLEAASWVLAAFRLQEARRRVLWIEPMPLVEVAQRLRGLPLFATLSVDELFRMATAGHQVRYPLGEILFQEGAIPESLQLLLDGEVCSKVQTGQVKEIHAPAALGFQEVLEGRPMQAIVRTTDMAVCLSLSGEEYHTLLADDTELIQGLFRMLCGTEVAEPAKLVLRGSLREDRTTFPHGGMKPIEKALALKNIPVFSDVSAEELLGLASITVEVPLQTNSLLFDEADPPFLLALISGELSLESPQGEPALSVRANDAVGVQQTLAGVLPGRRARVVQEGIALRIDREDLFDWMAQRPDLLQQLFRAVFRAEAMERTVANG